ncbi:MAG TPA: N-acetylneuraminate synthase family protein [Verrucomicrobiae bacterium]|jgi:N-acetylneuraminate synthase|nr:N-acetylneuraminate synthase family protein [Verrucomicrobiae bacterium]
MNRDDFEDLFVLEMTNNHLGSLERGLKIVEQHARIVRFNNVRAAIKLQFRDIDTFIHKDFRERSDIRYIKRVTETKMSKADYETLVNAIRKYGCIPMATPFDEKSVDWCVEFNMPLIKVASADSNDWVLLEKIAKTKKPVLVSIGGLTLKDMDDMVTFFENRNIPLALNHCVAAYPHEDAECELSQIDFLRNRYPNHTIGYSCHEYHDWTSSIMIAYAKGARTFERHIDIEEDGAPVAKYSSLPAQIDTWFKAFNKAKEMIGNSDAHRKIPLEKETAYLDTYVRGVYAKTDLKENQQLLEEDIYMAIPLRKGQISSRELMLGRYGHRMLKACKKDEPITIDMLDTPYAYDERLKQDILKRGI